MKQVFWKADKSQKKQAPMINDPKKDFKTVKEHFKNINNMKEFLKMDAKILIIISNS